MAFDVGQTSAAMGRRPSEQIGDDDSRPISLPELGELFAQLCECQGQEGDSSATSLEAKDAGVDVVPRTTGEDVVDHLSSLAYSLLDVHFGEITDAALVAALEAFRALVREDGTLSLLAEISKDLTLRLGKYLKEPAISEESAGSTSSGSAGGGDRGSTTTLLRHAPRSLEEWDEILAELLVRISPAPAEQRTKQASKREHTKKNHVKKRELLNEDEVRSWFLGICDFAQLSASEIADLQTSSDFGVPLVFALRNFQDSGFGGRESERNMLKESIIKYLSYRHAIAGDRDRIFERFVVGGLEDSSLGLGGGRSESGFCANLYNEAGPQDPELWSSGFEEFSSLAREQAGLSASDASQTGLRLVSDQ